MLKIRLQGTKQDLKWFRKIFGKSGRGQSVESIGHLCQQRNK